VCGFLSNYAVAVLAPNTNGVSGVVYFTDTGEGVKIEYDIKGLSDGEHGFHIHEYGDLTDGCESACAHFNPFNKQHGGLDSEERHEGDLGNIVSDGGSAKGVIFAKTLSLQPTEITSILGRMIIVHEDRDDLGLGGNEESLKTGNAGKRVGCGVIGLAEPPQINNAEEINDLSAPLHDEYVDYMIKNHEGMDINLDIENLLKLNIIEPFDKLEALKPKGLYFVETFTNNSLRPTYIAEFEESGFDVYPDYNHRWRKLENNLNLKKKVKEFAWEYDELRPIPFLGWNTGSKFYKFLGDNVEFKFLNWKSDEPWEVKE
jgi:Cu-Zn family superoxide dismutase